MKKRLASLLAFCLTLSLTSLPAAALEVEDAKDLLQKYYVDEIPANILALDDLDAILEALDDPYTVYLTAKEYQNFLTAVNGQSVVGIGVSVSTTFDNGYRIMSILPDSPALEAGLEAGDRIIAVDGVTATATNDIRAMIAGPEGTEVTITILRQADGEQVDHTLTRRSVVIPIVTYELVGDAGLIDCTSFGASTIDTVEEALETLDDEVSIWIMDLRSNPGGTSEASAGSAGLFVGGATMVYFRDGDGNYSSLYTVPTCPDLTDKPLIVLTSPHSASGSELFAADARDHGFGIGMGQRTFGKGIAQIVLDDDNAGKYFDGDALKLTAYRFYSPSGATNHTVGVLPTLLLSPENTPAAALLLSAPEPKAGRTKGYLKLELNGHAFYIDQKEAITEDYQAAFTELLESLPAGHYALFEGTGGGWNSTPISAEELAAKLALPYQSRYDFTDLADAEHPEDIKLLAAYGLVSGCEDGTFRPKNTITRAEFCAMVSTALNLPASDKAPAFSDVKAGAWYAPYVSAMAAKGYIAGCGDGTFHPADPITYEQMVTILSSAAAWCNMTADELSRQEVPAGDWLSYIQFSEWAQSPAWRLAQLGVQLDQELARQDGTRDMAAYLVRSFMESAGLFWYNANPQPEAAAH